jgi:sortase (surface protein transpeptidase)
VNTTRRTTAAIAATMIVLAGCAQTSGDPAASGTNAEGAGGTGSETDAGPESDADPEEPDAQPEADDYAAPGGDPDLEAPGAEVPTTTEEIAAAFNAHSGAHANHAPAGESREFPTGIAPGRVNIPAIGVDAAVTDLSLAEPEPEVPEDFDDVGWYVQTRKPGEIGPAVLAGHVDSRSGPAVFVDLDELQAGDEIIVSDGADEQRRFVVDELAQYPKDALPDEVFGFGEPTPQLRLITCGGNFDRASGHYRDNVVVYASLADG